MRTTDVFVVELEVEPRAEYGMMRASRAACRSSASLPLVVVEENPGATVSCETTTRSVPLMMNVPVSA